MTRRCRISALLPALLVLAACTTNPVTGKQSFTAFMSPEDEKRIGAEEHPKLIKEFGGAYGDAKLRAYVRRTGLKLVRVSEARDMPFTFTILDDDKVNAFALPGGYVYITRGLLALAGDEAEMAGVLAHEIGHVTARHTAERYSATMAANLGLMVLGVISSSAGVPTGVGQLVGLGAQAALSGYSREQELEADMLAVRYLARAGYSPQAMTSFFHKMRAHSELEAALAGEKDGGGRYNIMATHPRTAERINQAIGLAKVAAVPSPVVGREEFLAQIDGMVFGDDPHQGVRRGRMFMHPDLRIQFKVPPGFTLFNSPRRVIARGPQKSVIIFDMAREKSARQEPSLGRYMANTWASGLALRGMEKIDINGFEAVTAAARINTQSGARDLRLIALRGGPDRIFRLTFVTPPELTRRLEVELQRTTYSFRRLTRKEAASIKPLRIKVVDTKPGDTPKSLAARMPFETFGLRWFEVLNGLNPGQGLRPGRAVKIVTE